MNVVVIAGSELVEEIGELPAGVRLVEYGAMSELLRALRDSTGPAVLWSDGIAVASLETAATEVRRRTDAVIEVRGGRWDGETFSPLSAACRGVISGFGAGGVTAAVELLMGSTA